MPQSPGIKNGDGLVMVTGRPQFIVYKEGYMFRKRHGIDSCGQMKHLKSVTRPKNGVGDFSGFSHQDL